MSAIIDNTYRLPRPVSEAKAAEIVVLFTNRVPDYEFEVVHAEMYVKETVLA